MEESINGLFKDLSDGELIYIGAGLGREYADCVSWLAFVAVRRKYEDFFVFAGLEEMNSLLALVDGGIDAVPS